MKYISSVIALGAFCIAMGTSCTKETNNNYGEDDRTPIRLSSNVELGALRLQELQIAQGQKLSFFVTTANNVESVLYDNEEIIADGDGGFGYEETMYYPTNGDNVDFYAVHPYYEDATLGQTIPFTLEPDQTIDANYLISDLLYATREDIPRSASAVRMTFYHRLSQLNFQIIQGSGADITGLNAVGTLSVSPSVTIDPATGSLGAVTGTKVEVLSNGVVSPDPGATTISGISSIIVPQTFPAGQRLFRIRLGNIDYFYTPVADQVFQPGYKYTLKLTINQAGIDLVSEIAEWTDGGSIEGIGTIE